MEEETINNKEDGEKQESFDLIYLYINYAVVLIQLAL
jgi:hypothetical protein